MSRPFMTSIKRDIVLKHTFKLTLYLRFKLHIITGAIRTCRNESGRSDLFHPAESGRCLLKHRHRGNAAVLNWCRNALFDAMMQMIYPTVLRSRYERAR